MLTNLVKPTTSRNVCRILCSNRFTQIDHSHEKPLPYQLEHVQTRLSETVPLMFRQRLDFTFYRKDVLCDDQIFNVKKQGLDELVRYFGMIGTLGQVFLPHVEMTVINVIPMIEDGTVRCFWRVNYISFIRLLMNPRLLKREYRLQNLSNYDGLSVLTLDGNGNVYKITIQKTIPDEEARYLETNPAEKLKHGIAVQLQNKGELAANLRGVEK